MPVFTGVLLGYLCYDCIHYAIHHTKISRGWMADLRKAHLNHHFRDPSTSFGISSRLIDCLLQSCANPRNLTDCCT